MFQQEAESEGVQPNHNNNMPNSISEEPINRLPSNLRGSAHQSQLFYMPNSSSEEPIHPLPSNLRESSHQSDQFFEPEIELLKEEEEAESEGVQPNVSPSSQSNSSSEEPINQLPGEPDQLSLPENEPEIWSAEHLKYYRSLHNAAKRGDWESAISFIEKDPNALAARITVDSRTVFHVAALCDQWEFILKLLELVSSPESIAVQDKYGKTVLHYVALGRSLKTAKALVQKNVGLPHIGDTEGDPPLLTAIWSESTELVWYLNSMTSVDLSPDLFPWILCTLIKSGYHDITLYIIQRYPKLAVATDGFGNSLLYWLVINPSHFFSGSNLRLIERWIYKFVDHGVEIKYPSTHSDSVTVNVEDPALQPRSLANRVLQWFKKLPQKAIVQLAPSVKMVRDAKLKHECAVELVNHVCTQLSNMSFQEIEHFLRNPDFNILDRAIKCGIEEIVRTLLLQFPDLIEVQVLPPYRNILQAAIEYRQENIVNVIKEISTTTTMKLGAMLIESDSVTLHLAGKLAPAF